MPPEDDDETEPLDRSTEELIQRIENVNQRLDEFRERLQEENVINNSESNAATERWREFVENAALPTLVDPNDPDALEQTHRDTQRQDVLRRTRGPLLEAAQAYLDERDAREEESSWTLGSNPENDFGSAVGEGEPEIKYCYEKNMHDLSAQKFHTVDGRWHGEYHIIYRSETIAVQGFYYNGSNHGRLKGWDVEGESNLLAFYLKSKKVKGFPFLPPKPRTKRNRFQSLEM